MNKQAAPTEMPVLLKVKQVDEFYGIPRSTLYEMLARGELKVVRLGRAIRIPRSDLDMWIADRRTSAA